MDLYRICRRAAAWMLTLALAVVLALPGGAVYAMPIRTANAEESIYLFNAVTGEVLLDQNAGQQRCVASLTKMMTALLLLESGKNLDETITVPADQLEALFAMTPYYWKTPRDGAARLAALPQLTTEISFRFLVFEKL